MIPAPVPLKRRMNSQATLLAGLLLSLIMHAHADPILTSWFTENSGMLARVIQGKANATLTTPVTTWPSAGVSNLNENATSQSMPAYSDIQRIRYTSTDVYINANGLASYTMGPWYSSATQTSLFSRWPLAKDYQIRITRSPSMPMNKTKHPGGLIALMVNGVAVYDLGDAHSFASSSGNASTPTSTTGSDAMNASGYWSRDALAVEVTTFDPGFAHQPGNGQYHYHAQPKALRYQLGDGMSASYNATTNTYTYSDTDPTGAVTPLHHSPILGWSFDGYPIYGPYGYSSANNSSSSITRMRSGFVLRNGSYNTANLTATGRTTLPKWTTIAQGYRSIGNYTSTANLTALGDFPLTPAQYGPAANYTTVTGPNTTTYSLGRYIGDYDFLGDNGYTQGVDFDLDQYNGRNCVTPEYPSGIYAYFVTIDSSGNTVFPHMLGKEFYGTPNYTANATIPTSGITELFNGGPNLKETLQSPTLNTSNNTVTISWSSVEGGTYAIEASSNLSGNWTTINSTTAGAAQSTSTNFAENGTAADSKRFYRVKRTATATYDPAYTGQ